MGETPMPPKPTGRMPVARHTDMGREIFVALAAAPPPRCLSETGRGRSIPAECDLSCDPWFRLRVCGWAR
jgi:hypothetical protein